MSLSARAMNETVV
jgi:DNA-binding MarR family transcriptional regulator